MPANSPLSGLERLAILAIILTWGLNNAAAKVATAHLPPMMVGGLRFALALLFLFPFIKPPFPEPKKLLIIMLLSGPVHFGLIYVAFGMGKSLSPLVVASQLWIPFTALAAWKMLGETMRLPAVIGLIIAFVGVAWMSLDPHGAKDLPATVLIVAASACWAVATILVRQTPGVKPLKMQGMTAVIAAPALIAMSFAFEPRVVERVTTAPAIAWACVAFAGRGLDHRGQRLAVLAGAAARGGPGDAVFPADAAGVVHDRNPVHGRPGDAAADHRWGGDDGWRGAGGLDREAGGEGRGDGGGDGLGRGGPPPALRATSPKGRGSRGCSPSGELSRSD
jgi:O-acetylserine/cysteine efflux transporter